MKYSRYRCGLGVLNGEIYILGQTTKQADIQIAYSQGRMEQDDLCVRLYSPGGIGCDGEDRGQSRRCLTSVEIYNPETDTWRAGPSLPTPLLSLRTNASNVGVAEGKLYLCGYYKGAGQSVNCFH